MTKQLLVPLLIIFVAAVVAALVGSKKSRRIEGRYKARKLLTDNEREFFDRLIRALPEHYVFPQVAMSALLEPSSSDKKQAHIDYLRIAQQRPDYVICDLRCNVVAVVELDDKSHTRAKDDLRDSRLRQGGICTVRFQSNNKPTIDAIRTALLSATSESEAVMRVSKDAVQGAKPEKAIIPTSS